MDASDSTSDAEHIRLKNLKSSSKLCLCCNEAYKLSPAEMEWRQYCSTCYFNKGNNKYDIIQAGINSKGYPVYKTIPKEKKLLFVFDEMDLI